MTLQREHDLSAALTYAFEDGIATIAIDDGKANVMSVSMLRALDAALDRAAADKAVVVLRGRTGMFSAGFDLSVFKRDPQELFDMLRAGAANIAPPESLAEVLKSRTDHLRKLDTESFTATKLRLRGPALGLLRDAIERDVEGWSKRFPSPA